MISPEEFQSDVCWPFFTREGRWKDCMASFCPSYPPACPPCKHFPFCCSKSQWVRASLVNRAAHTLGEVNFEHGRSSLKLVWPWFKFYCISVVMDFQCRFSEWEPLKWNNMRCYRSVCRQGHHKGRQDSLPRRRCTIKAPRSSHKACEILPL